MGTFIIIVIGSVIIVSVTTLVAGIVGANPSDQERKEAMKIFNNINDFTATKKYQTLGRGSVIAFDENRREVLIMDRKYFSSSIEANAYKKVTGYDQSQLFITRIKFSNILKSEIKIDNETVATKSVSRTLSGAFFGGVLAGNAGTIVGGLSGNTRNITNVKSIDLVLTSKILSYPTVKFRFFDGYLDTLGTRKELSTSDLRVKIGLEKSAEWQSIMTIIIDQEDKSGGL